jgi:hypothetical protein
MARLGGASDCVTPGLTGAYGRRQRLHDRLGLGVAASLGTAQCPLSTLQISAPRQDQTEAGRRRGVLLPIGHAVGRFRPGDIRAPLQQGTQVEAAVGVSALLGPPIA